MTDSRSKTVRPIHRPLDRRARALSLVSLSLSLSFAWDFVSLRLAYDNKDKALNQSTNQQWEKTENGQNQAIFQLSLLFFFFFFIFF